MLSTSNQTKPNSTAAIEAAALELVHRYGEGAIGEASRRADEFARDGLWVEHDLALRLLTAVENILWRR